MRGAMLPSAAGAQGELTGILMMRAYHKSRGDTKRTKMLIPDAAHGTNPASVLRRLEKDRTSQPALATSVGLYATCTFRHMDTPGIEVVTRCRFMGLRALYNGVIRFTNVKIARRAFANSLSSRSTIDSSCG